MKVIPETEVIGVPPSPTDKAEPPEVIPDISTEVPSLLLRVIVEVLTSYVPPVTEPLNPEIEIVPPVLLNKSKVVVAE